jgi:protein-S-isoprenylcysteine O-methyltransferase Ste14
MPKGSESSNQSAWSYAKMLPGLLVFVVLAVVCLIHWRSPQPFSRVDLFAVGGILMNVLWWLEQTAFSLSLPPSSEVKVEVFGMNYDPQMAMSSSLLTLVEFAVFLDYGHWQLVPVLEQPLLQSIGLLFYLVAIAVLRWADVDLARHFQTSGDERQPVTHGAYRYIRHPRYAALTLSKLAFALIFASLIGWLLLALWLLIVRRRIRREEPHLREVFGGAYAAYTKNTARLLPFVY